VSETVATIDRFLDVVRKSGLVDAGRLDEAVAGWPDHDAALPEELVQTLVDRGLLTRWQADQLLKGRYKGFMLGKYKLLGLLGAGGMSSVYLAENTSLQGKVAIKVLPRKFTEKTSYLARFEREARTAWRLSHPNIVRAFDLETAGPIHFIAMEYVDGVDLHAKVKRDGPLPVEEAIDLIRQAALGLQHAHEEGLVHRDVKPANLILNAKGVVKILDLGLASANDEDGSLTDEHKERVLGTADYLAPEQAKQSRDATPAADIYSLGCTLHFLLTGRPPFAGGRKLAERIRAHAMQPPPNLLDERPDLPPEIVSLFLQMMEKNPAARPASAGEVAERLGRWLERVKAAGGAGRSPLHRQPLPRRPVKGSADAGPEGSGSESRRELRPPVVRRGPGSQAGLTPPPRSASRETLPMRRPPSRIPVPRSAGTDPRAGMRPAAGVPGAGRPAPRTGDGSAATVSGGPAGPGAGRPWRSLPPSILGQPPLVWAAIVGGLVLVAVLGVLVYRKRATTPAAVPSTPPRMAVPVEDMPPKVVVPAEVVPADTVTPDPVTPEQAPATPVPPDSAAEPAEPVIAPGGQTLDDLFGRGPPP
jgi:serine/threonine protein kinase